MTSSRTRGQLSVRGVLAIATVLATAGVLATGSASASGDPATPSLPPTGAGIDISFPQCLPHSHIDLPSNIPFAVIGVNGGVASNSNPCFVSEYNSALLFSGRTEQPHAALYVNTGNPALAGAWWPTSDTTQAGTPVANPNAPCLGEAGPACAYIYGYSMAQADYRRVRKALPQLPDLWWLDVETSNTWQPDVVANTASLTGMVDYFQSKELEVGVYSTSYQWNRIAGVTPPTSSLAGLRSWLAGGSYAGAPADCERSPLTPSGWVAMVQYVSVLDHDYSCHQFVRTAASIVPAVTSVVGSQLTANVGTWAPTAESYSYQWNRNGVPIPGAVSRQYVTTTSDAGRNVTVTISGSRIAFSTTPKTSEGVFVLPAPTA